MTAPFRFHTVPDRLRYLPNPPVTELFGRGDRELVRTSKPAVAIVGARAATSYGLNVARRLAQDLAKQGVTIVSGLARGVDGEAHRGALDVYGRTIAVLGCGIDRDYPAVHAGLALLIETKGGLIVSEYEPGTAPAPWRFPARNRIIAGLCDAMIVVEARERSGALIAADYAMDLGKPVFAVPGEITSLCSSGTNRLLTQGAKPCLGAESVLPTLIEEGLL